MKRLMLSAVFLPIFFALPAHAEVPDGYVVKVDSATLYLDWGKASGVKAGDRFTVYHEGELLKHPVTGQVLGHAQKTLGTGTLQTVEDKFSIGQTEETRETPQAGDRTHWQTASLTFSAAPEAAPPNAETSLSPPTHALSELWRSEPLEKDAAGITFSDLDGDGKPEVIIAYRRKIVAYRWKEKHLEPIATYDTWHHRHWLAVDAMDLKHDGHDVILATDFMDGLNRPHVVVLRYDSGTFKVDGELEGFARVIARRDGSRHAYWQDLSRSREMSFTAPAELVWEKGTYKPGPPVNLQLFDDQLFGYVWGDWDKSQSEELAVLEHGDRIRISFQGMKWKSSDTYGGTKNDFSVDNNQVASLCPRLQNFRPQKGDRDQLLVPRNIPELGIRMTYLKLFHRSELLALQWNDLDMQTAWHLSIAGYLADFGIADVTGTSTPQLWVAAVGPGNKTVLLSYSLP